MRFTQDQITALNAVDNLVFDPNESVLVISGSAGTGKSTLVKEILKRYINLYQTVSVLDQSEPLKLVLTATTNKAANNLQDITGCETVTIQKLLGMFIQKGKEIYPFKEIKNTLIIVDEFSYIGSKLLKAILGAVTITTSKLVFIGDGCQLPPVEDSNKIPVLEDYNFPIVHLNQQVRQETSALKTLGEDLKNFVLTGDMEEFEADGHSIIHYTDSELFTDNLLHSFTQGSSRFISYTNNRGVEVNEFIHQERTGRSTITVGDEMVVNTYFVKSKGVKFTTDTVGIVTSVKEGNFILHTRKGNIPIEGKFVTFKGIHCFLPDDFNDFTYYKGNTEVLTAAVLERIDAMWIDLRHLYASTVHKAQGSTFDQVFIDLTDFKTIRDQHMLARLLYVALTRARKKIHIIGEI